MMTTNSNKRNKRMHGAVPNNLTGKEASPSRSHGFASLVLIIASFLFITAAIAVSAQSGWFSTTIPAALTVPKEAIAINESSSAAAMTTSSSGAPAAQHIPSTRHHGPVQNIRFTVYDVGILPRTLHAQTGIVAVSIEDLSGSAADLVIERETGNGSGAHQASATQLRERVGAVKHYAHHWRGREELLMTPGRYLVYMANRPGNYAELIVDPQS